jgi:hypothetical protein
VSICVGIFGMLQYAHGLAAKCRVIEVITLLAFSKPLTESFLKVAMLATYHIGTACRIAL